jgi:hypothetical protein
MEKPSDDYSQRMIRSNQQQKINPQNNRRVTPSTKDKSYNFKEYGLQKFVNQRNDP